MLATEFERSLAFDLRASWQARALAEAKGQMWMVLMSVIAHTYDEALLVLMQVVDPNFDGSIPAPHLVTAAKISKTGAIVADVVMKNGKIAKDTVVFRSEMQMRDQFRKLADRLKLSDADRIEMFKCAQRWVVADRRLDPNFDPRDPDAKRIVN